MAKVSEPSAVAQLRETTLAAFADEQADRRRAELQERSRSRREHERAAAELLAVTEEKLKAQAELHSGEYEGMKGGRARAGTRADERGRAAQLDEQASQREALVKRLEAQAEATTVELAAAGTARRTMLAPPARARSARAVEQCNQHWMGVVSRSSASGGRAAGRRRTRSGSRRRSPR